MLAGRQTDSQGNTQCGNGNPIEDFEFSTVCPFGWGSIDRSVSLDVVGGQFGPLLFAVVLTHNGGANTGGSGSERGSVSSIF